MIDREQLIKDVAAAFVEYCIVRPWLSLSPEEVAGIVVDIVLKQITVSE